MDFSSFFLLSDILNENRGRSRTLRRRTSEGAYMSVCKCIGLCLCVCWPNCIPFYYIPFVLRATFIVVTPGWLVSRSALFLSLPHTHTHIHIDTDKEATFYVLWPTIRKLKPLMQYNRLICLCEWLFIFAWVCVSVCVWKSIKVEVGNFS